MSRVELLIRTAGCQPETFASAQGSVSDTAGETALPVIRFRCLHLGLSGWRSLSAKTRVNLA